MAKIILGSVQFGIPYGINNTTGIPDPGEINDILDFASQNRISILDTAEAYGDAQNKIAAYHKNHQPFDIITKFHLTAGSRIREKTVAALEALKIDSFHTLLYHRFSDYLNFPEEHHDLIVLKKSGFTKHIGVSIYTNQEFEEAISMEWVDVIQFPYNLLDNFSQRGTLITKAGNTGKILHARSIFLQGLLMKPLAEFPERLLPLKKYIAHLEQLEDQYGITRLGLCLGYVLQNKMIDGMLMGVDTLHQLKQNFEEAAVPLPSELVEEINRIRVTENKLLYPYNWQ